MFRILAASLLIVAGLAVLPAQAQSPDAPDPGPAFPTVYAHHNDDGTNDNELVGYMNALIDDPDSDDIAMGDSWAACTVPDLPPPVNPEVDRTWTLNLAPKFKGPVELDAAQSFVVAAFIGAGSGTGTNLKITTKLVQGSTVIFEGPAITHNYQAGAGPYPKVTWTLPPKVAALEAGKDLTWTIRAQGAKCSATGLFLGVHADRGKSNFTLPITPEGPGVERFELEGEEAKIAVEFENATNGTREYAWESGLTEGDVVAECPGALGSASLEIVDAANATVANGTLGDGKCGTTSFADAAPGNWTIRLVFSEFRGALNVTVRKAAVTDTNATASPATDADNETAGPADEDGGIPGPGVVGPLVALAATVALTRRRRR